MAEPNRELWAAYKTRIVERLVTEKYASVYGALQGAKPSGGDWMLARCPLHEDEKPSFGFNTTTGQWSCFSGCGKGDVFQFLERTTQRSFREVLIGLGDEMGLPRPTGNGDGTIAYSYTDAAGTLLYQVLRGPGKKFWQRRPDGRGGWINDLKGVRPVLYRLPELVTRSDEMVFVVEGEKDADTLHDVGVLSTTNSGGAGKWRPPHSEALRGRRVVILPDNDEPGRQHAAAVAKSLQGVAAEVRVVELPGLPPKGDVSDWLEAAGTVEQLHALVGAAPLLAPAAPDSADPGRPVILANTRHLHEVFADAWRAILAQNEPPQLFTSGGQLARVVVSDGTPVIQHLSEAAAYGVLVRGADWVQAQRNSLQPCKPPREVAHDFLANPHADLPELDNVVTTPVFDAQWRLLTTPGYHRDARLWLHLATDPEAFAVPVQPTDGDLAAARSLLLDDLLVDFPFAAASDRAHAVAALLLPFVRHMFGGPTPIHLLEAATPGSGKSLLQEVIALVFLGEVAGSTTLTDDENESRKKITALLSTGAPVIAIDNVRDGLRSAQIAAAITLDKWKDRLLGQTKVVTFRNRALWLVSANNPTLSLEIARRCVRIRIDPGVERPWTRTGFKHDPLLEWVQKNRLALARAVLTIVRSWIAAGAPQGKVVLGSFEGWSRTLGGMIEHLGLPGFLADADEFYAAADCESGEWTAFVTAWWAQHHGTPVGVRELIALADANDLIAFACAGPSEMARKAKLGKALNGLRGRRFDNLEVVIGKDAHTKARHYRLREVAADLFRGGEELA